MNNIIFPEISNKNEFTIENIGGKALRLTEIQLSEIQTPKFFILSAKIVNKIINPIRTEIENLCNSATINDKKNLLTLSNQIQNKFETLELPKNLQTEIQNTCNEYFGKNYFLSVRSSAISEDGSKFSFAGQHKTFLYVNSKQLTGKIIESIASAWSFSALSYRLINNISISNIQYAVVIQEMLDAKKSGVAFSRNPEGNLNDMIIIAGYGLGEGIVAEKVETDTYLINRATQQITRKKGNKINELIYDKNKGIIINNISSSQVNSFVLNEKEILQVVEQTLKCEKLLKTPADIEFSFDEKNNLHILQMRAITTIIPNQVKILDNTNIVESYPEISLPLTFSFALEAYKNVFTNTFNAFWLSPKIFENNSYLFDNLIAHYKGRIYYRLDNWYKMLGLVYTSKKSIKSWEKAVGLKNSENKIKKSSLIKKIKIFVSIVRLLLTYKKSNKTFFKEFDKNYKFLKTYKNKLSSPQKLWEHYQKSEKRLFKPWYRTLINDFLSFKSFGVLQNLGLKYKISNQEEYANDLLCGTKNVESADAVLSMLSIKDFINKNNKLKLLFELPANEIMEYYYSEKYSNLFTLIKNYVEKYGDRTLEELKLENPSFRKKPILFIQLLKNQLASTASKQSFIQKQSEIHGKAYNQFLQTLKWYNPRRYVFRKVYKLSAYGLRNRENMRFCRTRAYGMVKEIFEEIGKMMKEQKIIANSNDVFYLKINDLENFCINNNREPKFDFIKKNKKLYEKYENLKLPDRIMYLGDETPDLQQEEEQINISQTGIYKGIAVSKGKLTEKVVIIKKPDFNISVSNKIMISKMTDPGWVFLMAQSAGLISEKGSLLSHTAIVGRELGIPVVVGISNATSIFKNNDIVELNGNNGTVKLIKYKTVKLILPD